MPLFWTKPLDKEKKKNTKMEPLTLKSSVIKEKAGPRCGFPRFTIRQSFPHRPFERSPGFDLHTKAAA